MVSFHYGQISPDSSAALNEIKCLTSYALLYKPFANS